MNLDFRHSVIAGVSCWLAAMLAFALHTGDPWWAVMSAWVVSGSDPGASLLKAMLRIIGTLGGYVVGSECVRYLGGSPVGEISAMFLIGAVGTYQRFRSRFSYAWIIASVTALIVIIMGIDDPASVYQAAHYRIYEIIAGVLAVTVCQRLLGPILGLTLAGNANANATPTAGAKPPADPQKSAPSPARHHELLATAVIGGLLPGIIMLLWARFELPSLMQIIITAYITIDQDVLATRLRATQRILGCLLGGAAGLLIVFWSTDSLALWSLFLIGGIINLSRLHLVKSHPWSYVGTQGGMAFIMALVTGDGPPASIVPVVNRVAGMISGVLILHLICTLMKAWKENLPASAQG
ncbi:MAG: FUSC family protein [Verrucomicrobia bacterium]|nr:FUSC family protein [Verrucomicrobiota bacterium]